MNQKMISDCEKKRTYFSEQCAEKAMARILKRRKKNKSMKRFKPVRAYKCKVCSFYHLSSKPDWSTK